MQFMLVLDSLELIGLECQTRLKICKLQIRHLRWQINSVTQIIITRINHKTYAGAVNHDTNLTHLTVPNFQSTHFLTNGFYYFFFATRIDFHKRCEDQGPFLLTWINFPAVITYVVRWHYLSIPKLLRLHRWFRNRYIITSHTSLCMWLLIHARIKANPC